MVLAQVESPRLTGLRSNCASGTLRRALKTSPSPPMQVSFTPAEVAAIVQPQSTRGATTENVRGIAPLEASGPGDLSFLGNAKYKTQVAATRASVVLLPPDYEGQPAANQLFLLVAQPSVALAQLCARIERTLWPKPPAGIHPTAFVAPGARVAASATVGPLCVIESGAVIGERTQLHGQVFVGREARIGDDCWLMPGVIVAAECVLRNRVRLQPGVVIGSDGFGYEFVRGRHEKVPQVGTVIIEDDVEIGANSTLDRARFSRTVVGEGTKIDNLVQVAHNVIVGRHCIVCAQVAISGKHHTRRLCHRWRPGRAWGAYHDWPRGENRRAVRSHPFDQGGGIRRWLQRASVHARTAHSGASSTSARGL